MSRGGRSLKKQEREARQVEKRLALVRERPPRQPPAAQVQVHKITKQKGAA